MKLKPLAEQVAVVCGASSGIGRETALRLAQRGAKVVVAARSEEGLDSLVEEIHHSGGEAMAVPCDVSDFHQVEAVANAAVKHFGHLDTWVHCAAVSLYARFEDTTPTEFRRVIDVNLTGQAFGAMAALPHLRREGRGALIHISSVESFRSLPLQSAYAASKHGIEGFLDALRTELQAEGVPISVTSIKPAGINTPFFNKARTKIGVKPQPPQPVYEPSVVADTILYAAEHPVREMLAGGAGRLMMSGQHLSPALMDKYAETGMESQKTDEPKDASAKDNLFSPISGYDRVHGDFSGKTRSGSLYTWWQTHPAARATVAGAALGAVGLLLARAWRTEYDSESPVPAEHATVPAPGQDTPVEEGTTPENSLII